MCIRDSNYISAQLGSVRVYARLIDGEFINYQRILPTGWKTRVKVNCAQFSSCVERASLVARESKNNLMRIDVDGDRMAVSYTHLDVYKRQRESGIIGACHREMASSRARRAENGFGWALCGAKRKGGVAVDMEIQDAMDG